MSPGSLLASRWPADATQVSEVISHQSEFVHSILQKMRQCDLAPVLILAPPHSHVAL